MNPQASSLSATPRSISFRVALLPSHPFHRAIERATTAWGGRRVLNWQGHYHFTAAADTLADRMQTIRSVAEATNTPILI